MPDITQTASLHCNWLPALSPVWDLAAAPLLLSANRRMVFGADQSCDLLVTIPGVADRHCVLEYRNRAIIVVEAHAPVWVNDVPARSGSRIRPGDQVAMGSATFRVIQVESEGRPSWPVFGSPAQQMPFLASSPSLQSGEALPEQLSAWQNSLQARSNELSRQSQELEQRFSELFQGQSESEVRAREIDETQAAIRSDRLAIEDERAELQDERVRLEAIQSEITQIEQEDQNRLLDAEQHNEELETQARLLAENSAELSSQAENLEKDRAAFEEMVVAHQRTVEEDLARIAAQTAELSKQQQELEQHAHDAEQMLSTRQEEIQEQQANWDERDASLAQEQREFADREAQLNEKEQELQRSVDAFEQNVAEFEQREQSALSASEQQESLAEALEQQQQELEERLTALSDREAAIETQENVIANIERETSDRAALLTQRETALAEASRAAAEQHADHQIRMNELEQWAETLQTRQDALEEQAAELQSCRQQIAEQTTESVDVQAERDRLQEMQQELDQKLESLQSETSDLERRESEFTLKAEEQERQLTEQSARQTELAASLELRTSELQEAERRLAESQAKVDTKLAELNARLTEESEDESKIAELRAMLDESGTSKDSLEAQLASLESERDELASALQDMQASVDALQQQRGEEPDEDEVADLKAHAAALQAELVERDELLQQQESRLSELQAETAGRDEEIQRLQHQLETETSELQARFADLESTSLEATEQEAGLLRQIEKLQKEVRSVSSPDAELQAKFQEQQTLILELTEQLQQAETALNAMQNREDNAVIDEELRSQLQEKEVQLAELKEQLQEARNAQAIDASSEDADESLFQQQMDERDALIRDLQDQLVAAHENSPTSSEQITDEEIAMRSRELDDRTVLLDRRDEELGEWNRRLQNTEEDLESERRALQEARQQLELARAELQVSIEEPIPVAPESFYEQQEEIVSVDEAPVEMEKTESVSNIRNELASLFGMADEPEPMEEEPIDVCTEGGDSVVMSFEDTQGVLLEAQESLEEQSSDTDDSDYVTKYMEQLLSRSRGSAGESLPQELSSSSIEKPEPPKPKPTSFLDQYMQDHPEATASTDDINAATSSKSAPLPERPKIDVEAMRKDMNSFREVSVKSAQKALESHAMKKDQGGVAARQAVLAALLLMTLFVGAAQFMQIIDFPLVVWGLAIGTAGTGFELYRYHRALRQKVQELTRVTGPDIPGEHVVDYAVAEPSEIMSKKLEKFDRTVVFGPMPEADKSAPQLPDVDPTSDTNPESGDSDDEVAALSDEVSASHTELTETTSEAPAEPPGVVAETEDEEKYYEV